MRLERHEMTSKPLGLNIMFLSPHADEMAKMACEEGIKVVTTGLAHQVSIWKCEKP